MGRKDLSFTTPEGKKVYGSPRPPENIAEILKQQQEREFQFSKEMLRDLKPERVKEKKDKGGEIIELPPRKKIDAEKEADKKAAA